MLPRGNTQYRKDAATVGSHDRDMAVAGARFESYVKEAMREAEIPSLAELSRRSGIAVSAWHGWFRGERQPRRNSLVLAGEALSRTPEQLAATWQGERPQKSPKALSPDELVRAIDRQTDAIVAQTRMLALVLSRLVPSEDEPEPDELAAQRMYDAQRRPRPLPDPVKP